MELNEWMDKRKVKTAALAEQLGVVRQTVSLWRARRTTPSAKHIRRITEITKGKVKAEELLSSE